MNLSDGAKQAFEDLREYIEIIGDFLFMEKNKRTIMLRNMRESRKKLVNNFLKGLKEGRAELIVVSDRLVAPSALPQSGNTHRRTRASFPTADMPDPMSMN